MPRPKKPEGAPSWFAVPPELSAETLVELCGCVGLEPGYPADAEAIGRMRAQVEQALASYPGAEQALDRSPSPEWHREQFARLEGASWALKQTIADLDPWSAAKLRERGVDPRQVEISVAELRGAALVLGEQDAPESRGRPKKRALAAVVALLRQAFEEGARDDGLTSPDERTLNLREFVSVALDEAGIPHPEDLAPLLPG